MSPDGRHLGVNVAASATDARFALLDVDTGERIEIGPQAGGAFSPDGGSARSAPDAPTQVFTMRADGTELRWLTASATEPASLVGWSPDSQRVLFAAPQQ